jgi:hypothetical protein
VSFALQSDSEYMAGQLSAFGYDVTDEPEGADLWLINTYDFILLLGYTVLCVSFWVFTVARSICELN